MRCCNGRELPAPYQNQEQLQQQQQQHREKNNISKATARESQSKHKLENGRLSKATALFTMGLTLPKVGDMMRGVPVYLCVCVLVYVCVCVCVGAVRSHSHFFITFHFISVSELPRLFICHSAAPLPFAWLGWQIILIGFPPLTSFIFPRCTNKLKVMAK